MLDLNKQLLLFSTELLGNKATLHLMVTGVKSIIVVTLSRKAERMAAMRQRMMIMGQTLPLDSW